MEEVEVWKTIPGYELHEVNNIGVVKSLGHYDAKGYYRKERILKPNIRQGYLRIGMCKNGKQKHYNVHQLVAMAFLGYKPDGTHKVVVDHYPDRTRTNNNVNNLRLTTNRENCNRSHIPSTSKYVGVFWHKASKKWMSRIQINRKNIYLGIFTSELEASQAYQNKLKTI